MSGESGFPIGGHSDPEAHNLGNTASIFTSWSMSRAVANGWANETNKGGVVLKKRFNINETVPSPDALNEFEILVPGVVRGAEVTEINQ